MLTLFATPKPFLGHSAVIQRNAIQSWKRLHPEIEIILFGSDEGAAEVAREFSLRHEPHVEKNEFGTKRLDYLFTKAQALARYETLCYVNCDIILLPDLCGALEQVKAALPEFLMVGQRTDVDIRAPWPFERSSWQAELREFAVRNGKKKPPNWIDYFVFSRGFFGAEIPPFVLRVMWDNWLVWKALQLQKPVVDATSVVLTLHQNHDYSHHPQGQQGVWHGVEAGRNAQLAGGWEHLRTIADSTLALGPEGLRANKMRHWAAAKRAVESVWRWWLYQIWRPVWFRFLALTRPVRHALGLRAEPRSRN